MTIQLLQPPKYIIDILKIMGIEYKLVDGRHKFMHRSGWTVTGDNYMTLFNEILPAHERMNTERIVEKLDHITVNELKEMEGLD
jgi:hypothetical protein